MSFNIRFHKDCCSGIIYQIVLLIFVILITLPSLIQELTLYLVFPTCKIPACTRAAYLCLQICSSHTFNSSTCHLFQVIPAENIVAAIQGTQKTVFAVSKTSSEAQTFFEVVSFIGIDLLNEKFITVQHVSLVSFLVLHLFTRYIYQQALEQGLGGVVLKTDSVEAIFELKVITIWQHNLRLVYEVVELNMNISSGLSREKKRRWQCFGIDQSHSN